MTGRQFPFNVPVGGRYGAPMGRPDVGTSHDDYVTMTVRRIPMHDYDYDGGGAYWGGGSSHGMMFCAWSRDRSCIRYGRARSYLMFEQQVREDFPNADFLTGRA